MRKTDTMLDKLNNPKGIDKADFDNLIRHIDMLDNDTVSESMRETLQEHKRLCHLEAELFDKDFLTRLDIVAKYFESDTNIEYWSKRLDYMQECVTFLDELWDDVCEELPNMLCPDSIDLNCVLDWSKLCIRLTKEFGVSLVLGCSSEYRTLLTLGFCVAECKDLIEGGGSHTVKLYKILANNEDMDREASRLLLNEFSRYSKAKTEGSGVFQLAHGYEIECNFSEDGILEEYTIRKKE